MTVFDILTEGMDIGKVTLRDFMKKSGIRKNVVPVTFGIKNMYKDLVKISRASGPVNESLML